jgi:hypothetical protein
VEITEVIIRPVAGTPGRPTTLVATADVTFGGVYALHGVKVLRRDGRTPLVAAPEFEVRRKCPAPACRGKNPLMARFCAWCGDPLDPGEPPVDDQGRTRLFLLPFHPTTPGARRALERAVLGAWHAAGGGDVGEGGGSGEASAAGGLAGRVRAAVGRGGMGPG